MQTCLAAIVVAASKIFRELLVEEEVLLSSSGLATDWKAASVFPEPAWCVFLAFDALSRADVEVEDAFLDSLEGDLDIVATLGLLDGLQGCFLEGASCLRNSQSVNLSLSDWEELLFSWLWGWWGPRGWRRRQEMEPPQSAACLLTILDWHLHPGKDCQPRRLISFPPSEEHTGAGESASNPHRAWYEVEAENGWKLKCQECFKICVLQLPIQLGLGFAIPEQLELGLMVV